MLIFKLIIKKYPSRVHSNMCPTHSFGCPEDTLRSFLENIESTQNKPQPVKIMKSGSRNEAIWGQADPSKGKHLGLSINGVPQNGWFIIEQTY